MNTLVYLSLIQQNGNRTFVFWILMGAGVLVIAFFFWRAYRQARNQQKGSFGASSSPGGASSASNQEAEEVKQEFESILYELRDFMSESMAKLDTKVRFLNKLIMEADRKIERLEKLTDELNQTSGNGSTTSPVESNPPPTGSANPAQKSSISDSPDSSSQPTSDKSSIKEPEEHELSESTSPDPKEGTDGESSSTLKNKPMYRWVWQLADRGLNREEVANKTGLDEAEVDLIMSLQDIQEEVE